MYRYHGMYSRANGRVQTQIHVFVFVFGLGITTLGYMSCRDTERYLVHVG